MKYARVIVLSDNVEVILKKTIVGEKKYGLSMNFITEEDGNMINITTTAEYSIKQRRDKVFSEITKNGLLEVAATLPTFKDVV
jgi:phage portal protein BeeE